MSNQNTQEKLTVNVEIDLKSFENKDGQNIEYASLSTNIMGIDLKLRPYDDTAKSIILAYAKKHYKEVN